MTKEKAIEEVVQKATSMRNCNIRISAINNTKKGEIVYEFEQILDILNEWLKTKNFEYFAIKHNEDEKNIHYHLVLKFASPTKFDDIKNKFPYGNIQKSKSVKNSIQYLIHLNDKEKVQYEWEDIVTNSDELHKYKLKSKTSEELDIEEIIRRIETGDIREYQYTDKIDISLYTKYAGRIDKAFKYYYDMIAKNSDRKIEVEFYSGLGGTGKTWCAKTLCEMEELSYCISSSRNDVLQDYKGEDVLILDDLRDNAFSFDDLLKVLDNNTRSSIKSRYRNKHFVGKKIIITSNVKLEWWYHDDLNVVKEDKVQLYRRIKTVFEFDKESINIFYWSKIKKEYELIRTSPNHFAMQEQAEEDKEKDKLIKRLIMCAM